MTKKTTIKITGMHCQSCINVITKALNKENGVVSASVNFSNEKASVEYDPKITNEEKLIESIKKKGYDGHIISEQNYKREKIEKIKELKKLKLKIIFSAILAFPVLILGMFFMKNSIPFQDYIMWALATPIQFYIGKQFYQGTWAAIKNRSANMDTLIALGTSAAYFYSVYVVLFNSTGNQYFEASAVLITLVILGKYLEAVAKGKKNKKKKKKKKKVKKKA